MSRPPQGAPGPREAVTRPVGLETEYGITQPGNAYANSVVLASQLVRAYALRSRPGLPGARPVAWDYEGEDPLADQRGGRLDRASAHPSLLTDDPDVPAPAGDAPPGPATGDAPLISATGGAGRGDRPVGTPAHARRAGAELPGAPWGTRPRPGAAEAALPRATAVVLTSGARLYVDHAHPEYSSPEVLTPRDALVWDRAGEEVARRAMTALARDGGPEVVLYKNNVDGKGAAYGSHENYLLERAVPFARVAAALVPFLVTRPVMVGAGRVGVGQRSEHPGFQVSQRADYVGCEIGLQTTFNRPIVNTRDEPHADAARFRRLHVINGDANRFDVPIYLKVASTSLLLWYLERAQTRGEGLGDLAGLRLRGDPVEEHWAASHDTTLTYSLATARGPMTALGVQRAYLEAVTGALEADHGGTRADQVGPETARALDVWGEVLDVLDAVAAGGVRGQAGAAAAPLVEWVAKMRLCEGLRARSGTSWEDPRLAALDIQWADLRRAGVVDRLDAAGHVRRLAAPQEVAAAADTPPPGTRAVVRGRAVATDPRVVAASWTGLVLDVPGVADLLRVPLPGGVALTSGEAERITATIGALGPQGGH